MDDEISGEALDGLLAEGADVRIVDIRSPGAYERGHIPGSENIPFGELPEEVDRLDGTERVVTVCPHGEASIQAARLVGSYEGLDGRVESLAGGVEQWVEEGRPWEESEVAETEEAEDAPF